MEECRCSCLLYNWYYWRKWNKGNCFWNYQLYFFYKYKSKYDRWW